MNQYFSESILLALLYRTLGMIIVERVMRIYIFFKFGYDRTSIKRGGGEWVKGLDRFGALT